MLRSGIGGVGYVRSPGHPASSADAPGLSSGIVVADAASKSENCQTIFLLGLFDYLVDQLPRRTEIDYSLLVAASAPSAMSSPTSVFPLPVGNCNATSGRSTAWDA